MKKIMFLTIVILAAIVSSCAIKINDLPQDRNNRTDKTSVAKLEPQKEDYYANVFQIVTYDIDDEPIACGTGFVVSQTGQFITNSHVMDGAYSAKGIFESGSGNSQAYIYVDISGVLYNNENEDLFIGCMANYSRSVSGYRDLKYADSVTKGETTYSIGYPNAVTQMEIHKGKITDDMTTIADKLAHGSSYIGSTSYIAPGSSGGLLVNENGEILGITSRGRTTDYGEFVIGASIETRSFKKVATNAQNGVYISKSIVDTFHFSERQFIYAYNYVKSWDNAKPIQESDFFGLLSGYKCYYYDQSKNGDGDKYDLVCQIAVAKEKLINVECKTTYENGEIITETLQAHWNDYGEFEHTMFIARVDYPDNYEYYRNSSVPVKNISIAVTSSNPVFLSEDSVILNNAEVYRSNGFNLVYTWKDQDVISWAKGGALYTYEIMNSFLEP